MKERFVVPGDFDYRKLSGGQFGIYWGEGDIEVKILFTRNAAVYVRERVWHPSQIIEENSDGSLILSLTVNHLLELTRWILSWGAMAQVLEPPLLADKIKEEMRNGAEIYKTRNFVL
jgi:predicted DNA-binding transcriptional regulator YafY